MKAFFDTNILLYAFFSDDPKRTQSLALLADGGVIGTQVLNEFTSVSRKKLKRPWDDVSKALATIRGRFDPIPPLTAQLHGEAVALSRAHHIAFYDALIVAASIDAGCDTLYTEDMQHGRAIGGVTLRNPFL